MSKFLYLNVAYANVAHSVTLVDKSVPGDWIKKVPVMSVEECVAGLLPVIDNGTREKSGGMFINYDGGICTW